MENSESIEEVRITNGYSKDHRPDLKQFIMDVICTGDGDIPLFIRIADGNEADKAVFAQLMKQFREEWNLWKRKHLKIVLTFHGIFCRIYKLGNNVR